MKSKRAWSSSIQEAVGIAIPQTDAGNRWSNGESRFDEISLCFLLVFLVHVNVLWGQSHQTCTGTIFVCFCCACAGLVPIVAWFLFWFGACQCFSTSHDKIRMIIWWKNCVLLGFQTLQMHKTSAIHCDLIIFNENSLPCRVPLSLLMAPTESLHLNPYRGLYPFFVDWLICFKTHIYAGKSSIDTRFRLWIANLSQSNLSFFLCSDPHDG